MWQFPAYLDFNAGKLFFRIQIILNCSLLSRFNAILLLMFAVLIVIANKIEEDGLSRKKEKENLEKENIEIENQQENIEEGKEKNDEVKKIIPSQKGKIEKGQPQIDIRECMKKAAEKIESDNLEKEKEEKRNQKEKAVRMEQVKRKRFEMLAKYHQMDWQEVEDIETGTGEIMEWEKIPWTLVRGNGEGYRKRKRLKKLRWTEEARRLASLKKHYKETNLDKGREEIRE